jgi:hypothetical protein
LLSFIVDRQPAREGGPHGATNVHQHYPDS